MKKHITVSNLTLDLYLDYVRPAAIAADAEQQPTETENAPKAATQAAEGQTRRAMYQAITAAGIALHPCNAADTAPEGEAAIYYLGVDELTNIYADITAELTATEAEQAAPAADPDAATDEEEEATPATLGDMLKVRNIVMSKGGYRERHLLTNSHTATRSTWTTEHKVIEITETTPDPDGHRDSCAVDIVTRAIVG